MPTLILVLILITLVVTFSVQNASVVTVTLLFWSLQASLAVVIFASAVAGLLIGAALSSYFRFRSRSRQATRDTDRSPEA